MGWSFRKSLRVLPGVRITLSKGGPRLSVGVPGVRASVDMHGRTRIYGGAGPLRYQQSLTIAAAPTERVPDVGLLTRVKRIFGLQ